MEKPFILHEINIPHVQEELAWEAQLIQTAIQLCSEARFGVLFFKDNQVIPILCSSREELEEVIEKKIEDKAYWVPRLLFSERKDQDYKYYFSYRGFDVTASYYYVENQLIVRTKNFDREMKNPLIARPTPRQLRDSLAELTDALTEEIANNFSRPQDKSRLPH